jgi:DNA-binding XRE family transcriptional regulator
MRYTDHVPKREAENAQVPKGPGRPARDREQPLSVPVGMRLRLIREHRRLGQAEIRAMVNVSPSTYSSWETGKTYPTLEQVVTLARELKVSTDVLLGLQPLVLE